MRAAGRGAARPEPLLSPRRRAPRPRELPDGELDGDYREWHANGKLALELRYRAGRKDGIERRFDVAGRKQLETFWKDGVREGVERSWAPNGREHRRHAAGKRGKLEGPATAWYESGAKRAAGEFRGGARHGRWTSWREDGSKEKEADFDHGREVSRQEFPAAR